MKEFFKAHSYNMVKMFLNQFATAVFGLTLAIVSIKEQNDVLRNVTGACSVLFYLFLLYTMTWEVGFKDRVSVQTGRLKRNIWRGVLISLCANSINFILAFFNMLAALFPNTAIAVAGAGCRSFALILQGMYSGLLANTVGEAALSSFWFVYFLLPIPAILTCGIAYNMGIHDIKFTPIFDPVVPESDRDPSKKKWRK